MLPVLRGICSTSPKACIKYVNELEKYLQEHHVYCRVESTSQLTAQYGLTDSLQRKWEGIDQDILRASLHAKKTATKKHRPPWSLELQQASLRAVYWTIALSGERTHRAVGTVLAALSKQIEWDPEPPPTTTMSITDIQVQLQMVQAEQ
jgi:hypothetical protein